MADRFGLRIDLARRRFPVLGIRDPVRVGDMGLVRCATNVGPLKVVLDPVHAFLMAPYPRRQPASDEATAGDGREVVEPLQDTGAGQALDDAEGERGAADTTARDAEGGAVASLVDLFIDVREADVREALLVRRRRLVGRKRQRPVHRHVFLFKNLIQLLRRRRHATPPTEIALRRLYGVTQFYSS